MFCVLSTLLIDIEVCYRKGKLDGARISRHGLLKHLLGARQLLAAPIEIGQVNHILRVTRTELGGLLEILFRITVISAQQLGKAQASIRDGILRSALAG